MGCSSSKLAERAVVTKKAPPTSKTAASSPISSAKDGVSRRNSNASSHVESTSSPVKDATKRANTLSPKAPLTSMSVEATSDINSPGFAPSHLRRNESSNSNGSTNSEQKWDPFEDKSHSPVKPVLTRRIHPPACTPTNAIQPVDESRYAEPLSVRAEPHQPRSVSTTISFQTDGEPEKWSQMSSVHDDDQKHAKDVEAEESLSSKIERIMIKMKSTDNLMELRTPPRGCLRVQEEGGASPKADAMPLRSCLTPGREKAPEAGTEYNLLTGQNERSPKGTPTRYHDPLMQTIQEIVSYSEKYLEKPYVNGATTYPASPYLKNSAGTIMLGGGYTGGDSRRPSIVSVTSTGSNNSYNNIYGSNYSLEEQMAPPVSTITHTTSFIKKFSSCESPKSNNSMMKRYDANNMCITNGSQKIIESPCKSPKSKSVRDLIGDRESDMRRLSMRSEMSFQSQRSDSLSMRSEYSGATTGTDLTNGTSIHSDAVKVRKASTTSERYQAYLRDKQLQRENPTIKPTSQSPSSVKNMVGKWGENCRDTAKTLAIKQRNLEMTQNIGKLERRYCTF